VCFAVVLPACKCSSEYNNSIQKTTQAAAGLKAAQLLQHIHKHKNALWKMEWHQALCSVAQDGMYMQLPLG
jgi:hypothetical protein